ncbi:stress response protein SCP2 [Geodermatophilus tzadiensis]|uniref:Stress response protein SCP2 n=1 Tax=Geodermatophilus tzadiensis TaxID=1137988 RepID=A0A2T0T173_9ACTN|nr:TerD family protein [Geodermatophilus tzadiensis]PRY39414.1 stress response protein SCP2 [Geodermatophilus tzadiensis]
MTTLVRGANAPLRTASSPAPAQVRVELAWRGSGAPAALVAVACDGRGRALSPAHQVTWTCPTPTASGERFELLVDLATTPDDVVSVAFALEVSGPSVRSLVGLTATVRTGSTGEPLVAYPVEDLPDAPSVLVTEVYRRSGEWKVRAVGQGVSQGRIEFFRSVGLSG